MNILVVGCGSIGKRHIRNLLVLRCGVIVACDRDEAKRRQVSREFGIPVCPDFKKALAAGPYDAAFICTPPSLHVPQAAALLKKGAHCFIEKPLSHDVKGLGNFMALAKKRRKVVVIGYNFVFSPLFLKIKELVKKKAIGKPLCLRASIGYYLPYWRPTEDYRKGYGAKQKLGGGILLDASHEIHYARELMGEVGEVFAVAKKLSDLKIGTEDFAEVLLYHRNGAYSQIHFDYLQSNYRRSFEIIGSKGVLSVDINERTIKRYDLRDKEYHVFYEGLNASVNDSYVTEMKYFFNRIKGKAVSLDGVREAKRIQEILCKIKESAHKQCVMKV